MLAREEAKNQKDQVISKVKGDVFPWFLIQDRGTEQVPRTGEGLNIY